MLSCLTNTTDKDDHSILSVLIKYSFWYLYIFIWTQSLLYFPFTLWVVGVLIKINYSLSDVTYCFGTLLSEVFMFRSLDNIVIQFKKIGFVLHLNKDIIARMQQYSKINPN